MNLRSWLSLALLAPLLSCAQSVDSTSTGPVGGGAKGGSGGTAAGAGGLDTGGTGGDSGGSAGNNGGTGGDVGGSSGASGSSGSAGTGGSADPCAGVSCQSPPANRCDPSDPNSLITGQTPGTCDAGTCTYAEVRVWCPDGCANDQCVGDPCAGVSCNSPPANTCAGANALNVFDSQGTCSAGQCTYGSTQTACNFGCAAGVCNGDPCIGTTCNSPPASYCSGANQLTVPDSPGTCSAGSCQYTSHTEFCSFGCNAGSCLNDPCVGITCNTPPANTCVSASTRRSYSPTGSCSSGICSYSPTDENCAFGCVAGLCKDCTTNANCGSGNFCNAGSCTPCTADTQCGAACTNCTTNGLYCHPTALSCVQCVSDGHCGSGARCNGGSCAPCTTNAYCGPSCAPCAANQQCNGSSCAVCKTDSACGASCTACGAGTPHCKDLGATSACVECLTNADCTNGETCSASGSCQPPCPTTLTSVFSDDFTSPSSASWTSGSDVQINTSVWRAYTRDSHSLRINGGRLEVQSNRKHGQGYGYVRTGGAGAAYNTSLYNSTLKGNTGEKLVWSFNMQRDNPSQTAEGGFDCSSTSNQNYRTVGLAYVLATDSAAGLDASSGTCSASSTGRGYAVTFGGNGPKVRLIRFVNGLRNGSLTTLVESGTINSEYFLSARVTYNATNDQWQLEARSDGSSSFKDPSTGSYGFSGSATDATYVNQALAFSGPYLQTGCTGNCPGVFTARFDNVKVGVVCAQ